MSANVSCCSPSEPLYVTVSNRHSPEHTATLMQSLCEADKNKSVKPFVITCMPLCVAKNIDSFFIQVKTG